MPGFAPLERTRGWLPTRRSDVSAAGSAPVGVHEETHPRASKWIDHGHLRPTASRLVPQEDRVKRQTGPPGTLPQGYTRRQEASSPVSCQRSSGRPKGFSGEPGGGKRQGNRSPAAGVHRGFIEVRACRPNGITKRLYATFGTAQPCGPSTFPLSCSHGSLENTAIERSPCFCA
jgi:hypothetical protein